MDHQLARDDDGHWFVIPTDKEQEFSDYVEAVTKFWNDMPENEEPPEQPDWVYEVGGSYTLVTFNDFEIG